MSCAAWYQQGLLAPTILIHSDLQWLPCGAQGTRLIVLRLIFHFRLGANPAFINAVYQFLADRIKDKEYNDLFSKAVIEVFGAHSSLKASELTIL